MHYHETMSGLRFVITTEPSVTKLAFDKIFSIYVQYVVKNPSYRPESVRALFVLCVTLSVLRSLV